MPETRVLLIGWEATDWSLVDPILTKGGMPHLAGLIARGHRALLLHRPPLLPATLWSTLLTGANPLKHGVFAEREIRPDGSGLQTIGRSAQCVATLWQRLESKGIPTAVVGFPATHPAVPLSSASISDYWISTDIKDQEASVQPDSLQETLNTLRITPDEIDVATLRSFLPNASGIVPNDPRPTILRKCLAQTASWHAVATAVVERSDWRFAAVHYHGLGPLCRHFLSYDAPAAKDVSEHDTRCYADVITNALHFHDLMLGRLIELAGDDTIIMLVSNHGVSRGPNRPTATPKSATQVMSGLKREAMAVIAGNPTFQLPAIIPAADFSSIVLSLFGIDCPEQTLQPLIEPNKKPGSSAQNLQQPEERSVNYLHSLGYVDKPDGYARAANNRLEADKNHILALACHEYSQTQRAIEILETLVEQFPNTTEYAISLAELYASTGEAEALSKLVDRLARAYPTSPVAQLGLGIAAMLRGDHETARKTLQKLTESSAKSTPWLLVEAGRAMLKMKCHKQAIELFTKALENDENLADAYAGLASAQLVCENTEAAIASSQKAANLRPHDPQIMFLHGEALMAGVRDQAARLWLEDALLADPDSVQIIQTLAALYERLGNQAHAKDLRERLMLIQFHKSQKQRLGFDTALRIRG